MKFRSEKGDSSPPMMWRKRFRYFVTTILPLLLFGILVFGLSMNTHQYYAEGKELCDSIDAILIAEKLCRDSDDCTKKEYVFFYPATGVEVDVYGITDQSLIKKIVDSCIEKHAINRGIRYELTMYRQTKAEDVKKLISERPILRLILKKEE